MHICIVRFFCAGQASRETVSCKKQSLRVIPTILGAQPIFTIELLRFQRMMGVGDRLVAITVAIVQVVFNENVPLFSTKKPANAFRIIPCWERQYEIHFAPLPSATRTP